MHTTDSSRPATPPRLVLTPSEDAALAARLWRVEAGLAALDGTLEDARIAILAADRTELDHQLAIAETILAKGWTA